MTAFAGMVLLGVGRVRRNRLPVSNNTVETNRLNEFPKSQPVGVRT